MSRASSMRWRRIGVAVVLGELIPIAALFIIVSLFDMFLADGGAPISQVARTVGAWMGPILGAAVAFAASNWAGKTVPHVAVRQALIIGAAICILDLAILSASGLSMRPLSIFANAEKFAAALLGGVFAAIREAPLAP